jgi:hypothetical protein
MPRRMLVLIKRLADEASGLAKSCAKLGITFWDYLGDRLAVPHHPGITHLPQLVRHRCQIASSPGLFPLVLRAFATELLEMAVALEAAATAVVVIAPPEEDSPA